MVSASTIQHNIELITMSFGTMERAELVFLLSPGIGNLVSTVKFATQLLDRDHRLSITILLVIPLSSQPTPTHESSNTQRIRYVHLPPVDRPAPSQLCSKSIEKHASVWMERYKPHVKNAIINHVLSANNAPPLLGLVFNPLFTSMIDVGEELGVPSYIFFTGGAAFLGFMLYLGTRHLQVGVEFEESDAESIIPSYFHPVPTRVLPSFAFNKEGGYSSMVTHAQKFKKAKGIIINTFAELEPHAVSSFSEDGNPPIYTVGPILDLKSEYRPSSNEHRSREIMAWLDDQPPSSVVFLSFGSLGSFRAPQIIEVAHGLENSGNRFLWSLRRPPPHNKFGTPSDYDDYKDVLPDGFWERTKGKGMMCGWVPQVDILAHKAIGGFVSHCGWNSILESIWHGVPLVAWPLYAEQQINAFELVRDLGLAVEMKIDYKMDGGDVVSADQIETAVRCVMDSDAEVRKRVKEMSEKSRKAIIDGSSSGLSMEKLIDDIFSKLS